MSKDKLDDPDFIAASKKAFDAAQNQEHVEFTEKDRAALAEGLRDAAAILNAAPEMAVIMGVMTAQLMQKHGFTIEVAIRLVAQLHIEALRSVADTLEKSDPLKALPAELRTVVN